MRNSPSGKPRWPSTFQISRSRGRTRRAIACISRSPRCCSRTPSFGGGMSRFGPQSRWPSTSGKRPSGARCPLAWWCSTRGPRRRKAWISLLNKHRGLETASFQRRDVNGWALKLPGPHIAVEDLVPLIPANAYRPIKVSEQTYWCFTLGGRIAGLGQVRLVVSFEDEALTGRSVVLVTNLVDWG